MVVRQKHVATKAAKTAYFLHMFEISKTEIKIKAQHIRILGLKKQINKKFRLAMFRYKIVCHQAENTKKKTIKYFLHQCLIYRILHQVYFSSIAQNI